MTPVMISALEHRPLNSSITLTGTIKPPGSVGAIGGVIEKAQAAKQYGKTPLLLPLENKDLILYTTQQQNQSGRFSYRIPQTVDAKQYIEQNTGLNVEYVQNITGITEKLFS
jgi:predicted S18 family serine protease